MFGWLAVIGGPLLELFGAGVRLTGCSSIAFANFLLASATIGTIAGGVAALVLRRRPSLSDRGKQRALTLGVVALVLGGVERPPQRHRHRPDRLLSGGMT